MQENRIHTNRQSYAGLVTSGPANIESPPSESIVLEIQRFEEKEAPEVNPTISIQTEELPTNNQTISIAATSVVNETISTVSSPRQPRVTIPQRSDTLPAYTPYVMQQAMYAAPIVFGRNPQPVKCNYCGSEGLSVVERNVGAGTLILAGFTCLIFWPCAWIPFVVDQTKDVVHRCQTCAAVLGEKKML
ncbi:hypothetical protein HDV06_005468 [Boothiomyces sp. JEL0866]|nr:hypothetical protein HDV06_005468 [Boothiomyces sp. JEL0866]